MSESGIEKKLEVVEAKRPVNPWIVAIAVMFGTFMEVLDTTVVNVSLPHIAGSLSASIDEATWVLTSYLVANAIILPITGWLANYFGRKRLLMMSVTGFTVSSFFCGFATSLPMLIVFRVIQGTAGGALQPISQAVLLESFPTEQRGRAMGFWGLGIVVAPILGPVLGGWLTDSYSWRWVFYINIPVGIACIIMTKLFIFDPAYIRRKSGSVDYWGIGMLAVGIGALQITLDKGQQEDWFGSIWITFLISLSLVMLTAFVIYELRVQAPVVDLRVFKNRTYSTGTFLMTVLGFVLYGSLVLLPIWLQTLLGYPSLQAGIALAPRGLGSFLMMPIIGAILVWFDARKFLTVGLVIAALTLIQFSRLDLNAGYWDFFWPQFIQGVSLALLFVPLTTITMGPIAKEQMGNATSIFNLLRNIGGSVGIASVTTLLERYQQTHINTLASHVTPYSPETRTISEGIRGALMAQGSSLTTAARQSYAMLFGMVEQQAAILAFLDVFRLLGAIFLLLVPLVLLMQKPHRSSSGMTTH
ncbi:MAG TPA: DHA2 family efflux MFS transporter permease subunit [Terriglobia bacterium]|nr:DHA2 family efflux MFS transporter permease subunit [Terriglobia bacterium]